MKAREKGGYFRCKHIVTLFSLLISLSLTTTYGANPSQPFSPQDNILDPNCLPSDSNCYIKQDNQILINASTTNLYSSLITAINAYLTSATATSIFSNNLSSNNLNVSGTSTVSNILPQVAGTITSNVTTNIYTPVQPNYYSNDNSRWTAVGNDGFVRSVIFDEDSTKLILIRCLNNDCTVATSTTLVTNANGVDQPDILMGSDGYPRIMYINWNTPNELRFIKCADNNCSPLTPGYSDSLVTTGSLWAQSFALNSNDVPSFVYEDYTVGSHLIFVNCNNATCTSTSTTGLDIENVNEWKELPSMVMDDNDLPMIVYPKNSTDMMIYLHCNNTSCSSFSTTSIASFPNNSAYYTSIAKGNDGFARISYNVSAGLYYVVCNDILCSSPIVTHVSAGSGYWQTSLKIGTDGYARLTLGFSSGINYYQCTNTSCSTLNTAIISNTGAYPVSMSLGNDGLPRIVQIQYPATNGTPLKMTRLVADDGADVIVGNDLGNESSPFSGIHTNQLYLNGTLLNPQWTTSGNNIYSNNSGNVGIGTSTPNAKLQVIGLINFDPVARLTFLGENAGIANTTGLNNTAIGYNALKKTTRSSDMVAIGSGALENYNNIEASSGYAGRSIAIGYQALNLSTSSYSSIAIGWNALKSSVADIQSSYTGSNTAIGYNALSSNTTGTTNTALGASVMPNNTTGSNNIGIGLNALISNTTGNSNIVFGYAMSSNTSGSGNIAMGHSSLEGNITGGENIALGALSSYRNTLASRTIAIGYSAAGSYGSVYSAQGYTIIGTYAGTNIINGSDYNTFFGYQSGYGVTSGGRNVLIGQSTVDASRNQITTGSSNISIGNDVAVASSTASNQLNIGNLIYGVGLNGTGATLSTGSIGIGTTSPSSTLTIRGTGSTNPLTIASSSGSTLFQILSNGNVGIGTSSPSQLLHVGNSSVSGIVSRFQNSTGYCDINPTTTSLTCTSDERLKSNIEPLESSSTLMKLIQLRPVTYNWKVEENSTTTHAGLIAQEVQLLFPGLVAMDDTGMFSVSYGGFIPYIIQAIKDIVSTLNSYKESFTTKKICVDDEQGTTCLTRKELNALINPTTTPVVTSQPSESLPTTTENPETIISSSTENIILPNYSTSTEETILPVESTSTEIIDTNTTQTTELITDPTAETP